MSDEHKDPPKKSSSVHNAGEEQPPFGSRFLTPDSDMWSKNAWDHVPPPPTHEPYIVASLTRQRSSPVPPTEQAQYHERPAKHWDRFYKTNTANFFKDRKWLGLEFPELAESVEADKGAVKIVEVGCGAGNAVFPILAANRNPGLELFAYDYSQQAVKLVQAQPMYNNSPIGSIHADVWDLSSPSSLPSGVQLGSVDIVIMIFVMSALHPEEWSCAVDNVYKILKPGGVILFRDYGRHDLTQLRFKEGRLLSENFYIRGDKTRVYFFDLNELAEIFTGHPLPENMRVTEDNSEAVESADEVTNRMDSLSIQKEEGLLNESTSAGGSKGEAGKGYDALAPPEKEASMPAEPEANIRAPEDGNESQDEPSPSRDGEAYGERETRVSMRAADDRFEICQLGVDRRLLLNRKKQLKMYRVWLQGKFRKR